MGQTRRFLDVRGMSDLPPNNGRFQTLSALRICAISRHDVLRPMPAPAPPQHADARQRDNCHAPRHHDRPSPQVRAAS